MLAIFGGGPLPVLPPLPKRTMPTGLRAKYEAGLDRVAERRAERRALLLGLIGPGGRTCRDLGQRAGLSATTVVRELCAMAADGLIVRAARIAHKGGCARGDGWWHVGTVKRLPIPDDKKAGRDSHNAKLRARAEGKILRAVEKLGRTSTSRLQRACGWSRVYTWQLVQRLCTNGRLVRSLGADRATYWFAIARSEAAE